MSSILTNTGAMVALQTLKSTNMRLADAQSQIATGKAIGSAKDNAAVWAISKVMQSDVAGFKAISESLSLGESTVAVARDGAETVTDLLTQIKGKIVASQEENVDRGKIQSDIRALTDQIKAVVGAAQFNGLNLLSGTEDVNVLSSLDRSANGTVAASNITVARQDLSTGAGVYAATGTDLSANTVASNTAIGPAGNDATITVASAGSATLSLGGAQISYDFDTDAATTATALAAKVNALGLDGITASVNGSNNVVVNSVRAFEGVAVAVTGTGASSDVTSIRERAESITFSTAAKVNDGDGYKVTIGTASYEYVAGKNETMEDVAKGLRTAVDSAGIAGITTSVVKDDATGAWSLKVDSSASTLAFASSGLSGGTASGGLFGLDNIDVTTSAGADAALSTVETLIDNSISAAAEFGSAQGRIETQASFVGKLTDNLTAGIGALVDADMEEASARLQALQVQQQLGIQALSIANQAPQSILSLFR